MNGTTPLPLLPSFLTLEEFFPGSALGAAGYLLWAVFFFWFIYTVINAYHWFRYGHKSAIAIPALLVHIVVSIGFILFAASALV